MSSPSPSTAIALEWTLVASSFFFGGIRAYISFYKLSKQYPLADALFSIGWLCALGLAICDTLSYTHKGLADVPVKDLGVLETIFKLNFAGAHFFDVGLYFPKASLVAFYFQLIPVTYPKLRLALIFVAIYVTIAGICAFVMDTAWCPHIADNWSVKPHHCSLFATYTNFRVNWALDISTDVAVFILPLPMLKDLHLRSMEKFGVTFTFCLGLVTIAVSTARFVSLYLNAHLTTMYIWAAAEINISLIVVSLPKLGVLVKGYMKNKQAGKSQTSSSGVDSKARSTDQSEFNVSFP